MGNILDHVSAEYEDALAQVGQNRLEQVYLNMPEARFYFAGDREQTEENLKAYIGSETLTLQSLRRFSETEEGICYYCLLDVSASISGADFSGITEALSQFSQTLRRQDRMVCITFGEEVKTLFDLSGEELEGGMAAERLNALTNPDQKTLLFEAVQQMAQLAENTDGAESVRRVAFVITDGEDIAKGKATKEEALRTLNQESIPVYGFTVYTAKKDSINAFGEFCRSTGGCLTILEDGLEEDGFLSVSDSLLNSYEAIFRAQSNLAANETVSVSLEFVQEKEKQQMSVMQNRWMKDEEQPVIKEAVCQSANQIRVLFSEPVTGAGAADNYQLQKGEESWMPAYASAGSDGMSAVLTFSKELETGTYELSCENIKDRSMEQNLLDGVFSVDVNGISAEAETLENLAEAETVAETGAETGALQKYGLPVLAVVLIAAAVGAFLAWKRRKKQDVSAVTEGKVVLKPNPDTRHHVFLEQKKLEEKEIFFHVAGQKEEIRLLLQKSMIVGRASSCELIFDDPALSRQHFVLELKDGGITIQNLSQSGFTAVNGIRIGTQPYVLHPGDEIGAGQLKMTVRW